MSKERPLILVSNDDGISAPGIRHLIRLMKKLGDVFVVAQHLSEDGQMHIEELPGWPQNHVDAFF